MSLRDLVQRYPDIHPAHYRVGSWAWIAHRLTGLGIAGYLAAHIIVISTSLAGGASFDQIMRTLQSRFIMALDIILLAAILYHMLNGMRILAFDLGIGIRQQKTLFWGFMGAGMVAFILLVVILLPFVLGRPLG